MTRLIILVALAASSIARLPVPQSPGACSSPAHRTFDFWVGQWEVSDTGGHVVAKSTIERTAAGCVITEHWQPFGGPDGASINWYTAGDSTWHQQWVGGGGWIARWSGSFRGGVMTMTETESSLPAAAGRNRMNWTLLPDGRVKQWQENSKDGGRTWITQFVGYYRKAG
jgi:hypothetical protein